MTNSDTCQTFDASSQNQIRQHGIAVDVGWLKLCNQPPCLLWVRIPTFHHTTQVLMNARTSTHTCTMLTNRERGARGRWHRKERERGDGRGRRREMEREKEGKAGHLRKYYNTHTDTHTHRHTHTPEISGRPGSLYLHKLIGRLNRK